MLPRASQRLEQPLACPFDRLRFEADFRFTLVRLRETAEAVGLAGGEEHERRGALERFRWIVGNWWELIRAQRNLTLFTTGIGQINSAVPLLAAAPGYFLGHLSLGTVAQIGIAYGQVSGALVWFVNAYQEIASWRASIERHRASAHLHRRARRGACAARPPRHSARGAHRTRAVALEGLRLELPDGRALLEGANATITRGDHIAVVGPSGAGRTTLLRALAGRWPFGRGRIELPARSRSMFLPQRPYLPIATLRAAVSYPAPEGTFSDAKVLKDVELGHLAARLGETDHWEKHLCGGEQQRLAIARALLHEPEWIFLDDAIAALDEEGERRAYALLEERLPRTTVVSTAHRPSVAPYRERRWTLVPRPDGQSELRAA